MARIKKKPQREACSYNKGHDCPDLRSYQEDLFNWWKEYATRGEYNDIKDVISASARLRDYVTEGGEWNQYAFPEDLTNENKLSIVNMMLWKMEQALDKIK